MAKRAKSTALLEWVAASSAAVAATGLLVWVRAGATTAGIIFLLLVVFAATVAGRWLSLYIAVLCAASLDFFFLSPRGSLQLEGVQEWVAVLTYVASCVVVSRVAERARRQTRHAEQRREDVERLYELSQGMMLHEEAAALMRDLPLLVDRVFALNGAALYVSDHDEFYSSGIELTGEVKASLRAATLGPSAVSATPEGYSSMALMMGLRSVGALGWWPADRLSREVATAVGAQIAIALTRSIAIEASARLEASREGERLRAALIDSLTHELRTPLTSIRAAATTLVQGDGLDDAARKDLAALVDEEASRLDSLIGEAVEMAEIDAHVLRVDPVRQDPRMLLEQAVEESEGILKGHRVEVVLEGDEGPARFDPHLIRRVFRHLLENAARYTPSGSRITLRSRREGNRLEFRVDDNGPGIDALDLPLIFEKFFRGGKGAAVGKGTGMGLAITRAILAAHGGAIDVRSAPGQGTSFRFWVPLVQEGPEGNLIARSEGSYEE